MQVKLKRMSSTALTPAYETAGAAGADLRYDGGKTGVEQVVLHPGQRFLFSTGIALEIPRGLEGQIRPRSGMAVKQGLTVLNAPGTVDADYRGELKVCLINHGQDTVTISPQDRIAQLVIAPVEQVKFFDPDGELSETDRGAGGFGSTGDA